MTTKSALLVATERKLRVYRTLARDLFKAALLMEDDGPGMDSERWETLLRRARQQFPNETAATRKTKR